MLVLEKGSLNNKTVLLIIKTLVIYCIAKGIRNNYLIRTLSDRRQVNAPDEIEF